MPLGLYTVNQGYCNFLRNYDSRVPYNFDVKVRRPFVGIILQVNFCEYFSPLTSPKPKHLQMHNSTDFLKINDGVYGAINFNNMIPVFWGEYSKVNLKISPSDSKPEQNYKNLLINQLEWCRHHEREINNRAQRVHRLITSGTAFESLQKRCCDFTILEQQSKRYHLNQIRDGAVWISCEKEKAQSIYAKTNCVVVEKDGNYLVAVDCCDKEKITQEINMHIAQIRPFHL